MAQRFTFPREQAFDANGAPLAGGKLAFYIAGTSTPKNTFSDSGLTTPNSNPVVADSAGRFGEIFLDTSATDYKVVLSDSTDVVIWTADPWAGALPVATVAEFNARIVNDKVVTPSRLSMGVGLQGDDITSSASMAIPDIGDYFNLTGSATIIVMTFGANTPDGREFELKVADAPTFTQNATSLILPGGATITAAAGDVVRFRREGASSNVRCVGYLSASVSPSGGGALARGYIDGFIVSNDTTDATNDIQVAIGAARSDTNASNCITAETIIKQLDVAFAEYSVPSTASGGRDVDFAISDTTWYVFMIGGTGKNTQPFMSTSLTPNMPAGFTFSRRIGAILRVAGVIVPFVQAGPEFLRALSVVDADAVNPGTAAVLRVVSVPLGIRVHWIGALGAYSGTNDFSNYVSSPDQTDAAAHVRGTAALVAPGATVSTAGTTGWAWSGRLSVRTDTSAQIRTRQHISGAADRCGLVTFGWIDARGENA